MALNVPFAEARRRLSELVTRVSSRGEHVVITRKGDAEVVMIPLAEYESIVETLEILSDDDTMAALAASEEDVRAGRLVPFEDIKRKYNW